VPLEKEALTEPVALHDFIKALPHYCVRCFVCDREGKRLSQIYQIEKRNTVTSTQQDLTLGVFHNVFILGLDAVHKDRLGYLSDLYKNVATKENVMTYMHRLREDRLLCVDIMATALF
jgi:hypothetical protein